MGFKERWKENKTFNKFKKAYFKNHKLDNYEINIGLCDEALKELTDEHNIGFVLSYKCYSYLCLDKIEEFAKLSETVSEIEASIMVSYYRLLVALENDIIDFKEEYKKFVSLGRKMDTKGAFDMLKKEVDDIRRALKAKQKITDKQVLGHLQRSKMPTMQRIYQKIK